MGFVPSIPIAPKIGCGLRYKNCTNSAGIARSRLNRPRVFNADPSPSLHLLYVRPRGRAPSLFRLRAGAKVRAFALLAEQDEELHRFGIGGTRPVWDAGVELGGFPGREHQVVFAEDDS